LSSEKCPWCKFQPNGCGDDCDFKNLPFDKEAIIERMKSEMASIEKLRGEVERSDEAINKVMDKAFGIGIMSKVLKDEFKVKQKEIRKILGNEMSLFERTKLMAKLAMMKKNRGK